MIIINNCNNVNITINDKSIIDIKNELEEKTISKYNQKKIDNQRIAKMYALNNVHNKATRLLECATFLEFAKNSNTFKLIRSNSCRVRLCPLCSFRRSLKIYRNNKIMFNLLAEEYKYDYIFLTLTCKNCKAEDLKITIDNLLSAFNSMTRLKKIKNAWQAYIRNLEITYNAKKDTYHPHIHVLISVNSSYFHKDYIKQSEYTEIYKKQLKVDYKPVIDVRKIKQLDYSAIAEISKYATKYTDILQLNDNVLKKVVATLDYALNNRRLISYGFKFKELQKELKLVDSLAETDFDIEKLDEYEKILYRYSFSEQKYNKVTE